MNLLILMQLIAMLHQSGKAIQHKLEYNMVVDRVANSYLDVFTQLPLDKVYGASYSRHCFEPSGPQFSNVFSLVCEDQ